MGQSIRRSTDGGKTFEFFRGAPGGDDYHFLWIDPEHPERMIVATDQGTVVTVNGGESWSSWYNQPTGQFYHVATDDRFPYWIYSGQQDSGTVAVASRSDYGQLTFRDWHPVGGDERDYDIPFPGDPDIVYGSGLGGRLSRWDAPHRPGAERLARGRSRATASGRRRCATAPPGSRRSRSRRCRRTRSTSAPRCSSARPTAAQTWQTVSPDLSGAVPGTTGLRRRRPRLAAPGPAATA